MKKIKYIFTFLVILGCARPFDPEIEVSEEQPISIEAYLTDELKNHTVLIQQAKAIDAVGDFEAITNADVFVESNSGTIYDYRYIEDGLYQSVDVFEGEIGTSYKIVISIGSSTYESEFEEMLPQADIGEMDALFGFEIVQSETGETENEPKVDIFLDLTFSDEESFYRFDWNATYQANTPSQGSTFCFTDVNQDPPRVLEILKTCYVSEVAEEFIKLASSEGFDAGSTNKVTVFTVDPNKRFQTKYSPEIITYRITERPYTFRKTIENETLNVRGLFDPPLSPITGNIQPVGPATDRVIGVFEVASTIRKREFFLNSIVGTRLRNYERDCDASEGLPIPFSCCECTFLANSDDIRPDFWQ